MKKMNTESSVDGQEASEGSENGIISSPETPVLSPAEAPEASMGYFKNPGDGEWKYVNPAGSIGYNYLSRDDNWG